MNPPAAQVARLKGEIKESKRLAQLHRRRVRHLEDELRALYERYGFNVIIEEARSANDDAGNNPRPDP